MEFIKLTFDTEAAAQTAICYGKCAIIAREGNSVWIQRYYVNILLTLLQPLNITHPKVGEATDIVPDTVTLISTITDEIDECLRSVSNHYHISMEHLTNLLCGVALGELSDIVEHHEYFGYSDALIPTQESDDFRKQLSVVCDYFGVGKIGFVYILEVYKYKRGTNKAERIRACMQHTPYIPNDTFKWDTNDTITNIKSCLHTVAQNAGVTMSLLSDAIEGVYT